MSQQVGESSATAARRAPEALAPDLTRLFEEAGTSSPALDEALVRLAFAVKYLPSPWYSASFHDREKIDQEIKRAREIVADYVKLGRNVFGLSDKRKGQRTQVFAQALQLYEDTAKVVYGAVAERGFRATAEKLKVSTRESLRLARQNAEDHLTKDILKRVLAALDSIDDRLRKSDRTSFFSPDGELHDQLAILVGFKSFEERLARGAFAQAGAVSDTSGKGWRQRLSLTLTGPLPEPKSSASLAHAAAGVTPHMSARKQRIYFG